MLDHAYHGRTNLTMAMNFKAMPYGLGFGPFAGDVYRAPNSYPLHDGLSGADAAKRTISYLEKTVGAADLACLVVEPIQGEGGFMVPADGYLPALQEWCTANGIVFIADEIQSGMARTGKYFASEHFGLVPDIVLSAKGIAGGLPLAGVTGRAEIMDASHPGGLGGTFGGNPVACAAAIAVFEHIERDNLLAEATRIEKTLKPALLKLAEEVPVHRRGARARSDDRDRVRRPRDARAARRRARRDRGLRRPAGRAGPHRRHLRQRGALPAQPRDHRRAAAGCGERHRRRPGDALSRPAMIGLADSVELAVLERAGEVESRHVGAAVLVDADGSILDSLGDPAALIYPRSAVKPLQATAVLATGLPIDGEELVLAAASHAGTPAHVAVAERMLAAAGLDEGALQCPADWPLDSAARAAVTPPAGPGSARSR